MAAIVLDKVTKSFGPVHVIKGVDLDIKDREFVVFVGPSGCGKSTLLRLVAGLEDATSGDIMIGGDLVNDLPPAERGIAMVFQSYALYPHMSVYENMAFGMRLAKADPAKVDARVKEAARILQIEHLLDRKPKQLSGGQRQRVAIGRAITRDPRVFLFDEPLSNLDAALRVQTRIEIARLHNDLSATMIYVTHDQVEAMTLADRIVVLDQGVVQQFGSPIDLYQHPRNRFVAGFIGSPRMNFIGCTPEGEGRLRLATDTILPLAAGNGARPAEIGVRPEHLDADGRGDAAIQGRLVAVERLGAESWLYVDTAAAEPLVVKAGANHQAKPGDTVRIGVPAAACYLFASDGRSLERRAFH